MEQTTPAPERECRDSGVSTRLYKKGPTNTSHILLGIVSPRKTNNFQAKVSNN